MGMAEVRGHTDKGLWLYIEDLDDEVFVPYSQIHEDSEVFEELSEPGELIVTEWFARKREWF